MNSPDRRRSGGYMLVESVVGIAIMVVAFFGIYGMSHQMTAMVESTRDESRALHAAQYEIEKLRATSWPRLLALGSSYELTSRINAALSGIPSASGAVKISPFPTADPAEDVRAVSVTIWWKTFTGKTLTNGVTTLIARDSLP